LYNAGNAQHTDAQLIIGGVYVRVFVQQPQWTLRAPRHFLTELVTAHRVFQMGHLCVQVERLIAEMRRSTGEQDAELLEVLTQAFCALLQYHAGLSDQVRTPRSTKHVDSTRVCRWQHSATFLN
jgi:hypothetical protein